MEDLSQADMCKPKCCCQIVIAMCLHNFLKIKNDEKHHQRYCLNQYVDRETTEGNVMSGKRWVTDEQLRIYY